MSTTANWFKTWPGSSRWLIGKEISQSGFVFNYGHSTSLCRFYEILNAFSLDKSLKPYGSLGYVEQIRPDEVLFIYLFISEWQDALWGCFLQVEARNSRRNHSLNIALGWMEDDARADGAQKARRESDPKPILHIPRGKSKAWNGALIVRPCFHLISQLELESLSSGPFAHLIQHFRSVYSHSKWSGSDS